MLESNIDKNGDDESKTFEPAIGSPDWLKWRKAIQA